MRNRVATKCCLLPLQTQKPLLTVVCILAVIKKKLGAGLLGGMRDPMIKIYEGDEKAKKKKDLESKIPFKALTLFCKLAELTLIHASVDRNNILS